MITDNGKYAEKYNNDKTALLIDVNHIDWH